MTEAWKTKKHILQKKANITASIKIVIAISWTLDEQVKGQLQVNVSSSSST